MSSLDDIYSETKGFLDDAFQFNRANSELKKHAFDSSVSLESLSESHSTINAREVNTVDFEFGNKIREKFGKKINENDYSIGGHPDFDDLANTCNVKNGFSVSLFVDIKGSTKLGVIYEPDKVFMIKTL